MLNYYYKDPICSFLAKSVDQVIGEITISNQFDSNLNQNHSWVAEINCLQKALQGLEGTIFFEFSIPRMGKRVDALIIIEGVIFVVEFKVGEHKYNQSSVEQVWDYALDLKNFHAPSHQALLVPILVATEAKNIFSEIVTTSHNDNLILPIKTNGESLKIIIHAVLDFYDEIQTVDPTGYAAGRYSPTPTIIEAAISLYKNHTVDEITRSDADATNLSKTTDTISEIITQARENNKKNYLFCHRSPWCRENTCGIESCDYTLG